MSGPISPNFGPRRGGARPDMVVIHYTGMESCAAAAARLCDPAAEVSAHYLLSEAGRVTALVPEDQRAWHAGAGGWGAVSDVNSRSIGIELANTGSAPFSDPQMRALIGLLAAIRHRWSIPPERVIGHSDMAPGRKRDPGPRFDWRRLALEGQSIWPKQATRDPGPHPDPGPRPGPIEASLSRIGYPPAAPETRLAAFRLRFRPWARGPEDATDRSLAAEIARRFPVDGRSVSA